MGRPPVNPDQSRIVLRPRGSLESLDLAFVLGWNHAPALRRLARTWIGLPALAGLVLAGATSGGVIGWLPGLLAFPFVSLPFGLFAARALFRDDPPATAWRDHLSGSTLRRAMFVEACLCVAPVLCLGPLGVALTLPAAFWSECLLLERVPLRRALLRSFQLAASAPIDAVAAAVLARWALPLWGAAVAEAAVMAGWQMSAGTGAPLVLANGAMSPWFATGALMTLPLAGLWRLLLYVDARTRAEAWDLQVDLRAAGLHR